MSESSWESAADVINLIESIDLKPGLRVELRTIAGYLQTITIANILKDTIGRTICLVSTEDEVFIWPSLTSYRIISQPELSDELLCGLCRKPIAEPNPDCNYSLDHAKPRRSKFL